MKKTILFINFKACTLKPLRSFIIKFRLFLCKKEVFVFVYDTVFLNTLHKSIREQQCDKMLFLNVLTILNSFIAFWCFIVFMTFGELPFGAFCIYITNFSLLSTLRFILEVYIYFSYKKALLSFPVNVYRSRMNIFPIMQKRHFITLVRKVVLNNPRLNVVPSMILTGVALGVGFPKVVYGFDHCSILTNVIRFADSGTFTCSEATFVSLKTYLTLLEENFGVEASSAFKNKLMAGHTFWKGGPGATTVIKAISENHLHANCSTESLDRALIQGPLAFHRSLMDCVSLAPVLEQEDDTDL